MLTVKKLLWIREILLMVVAAIEDDLRERGAPFREREQRRERAQEREMAQP